MKQRGRPKKENMHLDAELILSCAKNLLLTEGKIPSLRKIATTLGIDPMSIYYYYPNKTALLEAITTSLMCDIYEPNGLKPWKEELTLLCKSYLTLLKSYPGLLETMLKMSTEGPSNVFTKRLEHILAPLKLNKKHFHAALSLLADYLHGFALALECDTKQQLSIEEIKEPLALFISAIENLKAL